MASDIAKILSTSRTGAAHMRALEQQYGRAMFNSVLIDVLLGIMVQAGLVSMNQLGDLMEHALAIADQANARKAGMS